MRSPSTGLSTIQKTVAETVEHYLQHGGPNVARAEVRAIAATFSYRDDWPPAYRWALERISQAEMAAQMETEMREQQKLNNLMTSMMAAAHQQTFPPANSMVSSTADEVPDLSDSHICHCLERLMAEEWKPDELLFNKKSHWQALFRILSDFGKFADDDFDGFDSWVHRVVPPELARLYSKQSVKNISQTLFNKPFDKWVYDPELMKKREPYDRMEQIARRFKELLEGRQD